MSPSQDIPYYSHGSRYLGKSGETHIELGIEWSEEKVSLFQNKVLATLEKFPSYQQEAIQNEIDLKSLKEGLTLNAMLVRMVESGSTWAIEFLLALGADPNELISSQNALHRALCLKRSDVVPLLLAHGADVNRRDIRGNHSLSWAIDKRDEESALLLLKRGADRGAEYTWPSPAHSALEAAAMEGLDRVVQRLIDLGEDVTQGNSFVLAAANGRSSTVDLLAYHIMKCASNLSQERLGEFLAGAVRIGSKELAQDFLRLGAPINHKMGEECLLSLAMRYGREDLAIFLIDQGADISGPLGVKAVSCAAKQQYERLLAKLVEKRVDLNTIDPFHLPPLFYAAMRDDVPTMRLLLDSGADIDLVVPEHGNALNDALKSGAYNAAKYLLKMGIKVEGLKSFYGYSPLHWACGYGFIDIVRTLLDMGADVNIGAEVDDRDSKGVTPIMFAIRRQDYRLVSLLMDYDADIWAENQGITPVGLAVMEGWREWAHPKIQKAKNELTEKQLGALLINAIVGADSDLAKDLIDWGAPVNYRTDYIFGRHTTPLLTAIGQGNEAMCILLLEKEADMNLGVGGVTPLIAAINHTNGAITKMLVKGGVSLDVTGPTDASLLHYAAGVHCLELAKHILSKKMNPNAVDMNGDTPLHTLAHNGHGILSYRFNEGWYGKGQYPKDSLEEDLKIARLLIENGADLRVGNDQGLTPLHLAVKKNRLELVSCLIALGADVNLPVQESKESPLHLATSQECVNLLLDKGARLEIKDARGFTPLHYAVWSSSIEAVQALLDRGADIQTKAFDGSNLTASANSPYLIDLLIKKGAPHEN